jgi:N-acetylglutamate synthase
MSASEVPLHPPHPVIFIANKASNTPISALRMGGPRNNRTENASQANPKGASSDCTAMSVKIRLNGCEESEPNAPDPPPCYFSINVQSAPLGLYWVSKLESIPMSDWQLRPLLPDDHLAAVSLWNACEGVRANESADEFRRILERNPGFSSAAEAGGQLVGAVLCCHDGRRGYLYHLGVDAAFRRQGIGEALVERSLERLRSEGIARCSIHLIVGNEVGERFWKQIGWRFRDDLLVMAIDL